MSFIPSTWIKSCSFRTDFKKIYSLAAVLVLTTLCFPVLSSACVVSCKSSLNVSLDNTGQATITPLILLQDPSCNPSDFNVDLFHPNGQSVGNTLTCDHVGLTMNARVTQTNTGNFCWTSINVGDYINPQIECIDTVILCNQSVDPSVIGYPLATDNCSVFANADLHYTDEFMDLACFAVHGSDTITSQIQRTWSVQDESGNVDTCIQMIYLKRVTINDVSFPAHLDGFAAPALDCSQDPTNLSLTGEPSINDIPLDNAGNCELVASFTDQIIPLCGSNAYRLLRTWTVIDYCSSDFTLNVQIINVTDHTAPVITCPADITVGTNQNDCSATINLPLATATDNCSEFTITPSWAFGTGHGPFFDIPVGLYPVTYTATDDCGNSSSCTMMIRVEDNIPPTPVCDYNTTVDLSVFGNALVYASTFDDGSHDNCEIDSFAVSRDGINFGASVSFDCSDIENSPIEVTLGVWDIAGNYNECTVNVIVDDRLVPAIACLSDVYIECTEDYTDLDLVGLPIVDDNCSIDTLFYYDVSNLNDCNEGTVLRTWTVRDAAGNLNHCTQTIILEDNTPLGIVFPTNFATSICDATIDPSISGEPTLVNKDCENTSVDYSDEFFHVSPSCYRILRTWTVYEWCTFNPNDGSNDGFWTDVQFIDVEDHTAPELVCLGDTSIQMFTANCSGVHVNLEIPQAIDCNPEVEITNNSPYAINSEGDASGFYPPGSHTITYTATDGCGNYTLCNRTIHIVDAKAPTAICNGGINLNIEENGLLTITPEMIDLGSYDNCTASENLVLEVSPATFTCDDLGPQTVTLSVRDEAGNIGSCTTIVTVQNNNNVCATPSAMIAGVIEKESGVAVQGVELILSGDAEGSVMNDETGYFEFLDLPLGSDYEITPFKNTYPKNGVSTFDLVFMQRHVLGLQPFTSPYTMIAADVNNSGNVSTFDIVRLRRLILQLDTEFTNNTSWRFVQSDYVFPNGSNPFLESFPESLIVNQLETDILSADFIAIKVGDVTGNANPANFNGDDEGLVGARNQEESLVLSTVEVDFKEGALVEIPVYSNNFDEILGYQTTFDFDPAALDFVKIKGGTLEDMSAEYLNTKQVAAGLLSTSWLRPSAKALDQEAPLFTLTFRAKKDGRLSNSFHLSSRLLASEAYNERMEILGINFEFSKAVAIEKESFMLYQNYPNPFESVTNVPFYLPTAERVSLEILDAKGVSLQGFEKEYEAGHQEVQLYRKDFKAAGIYFIKISLSTGEQQTKTLIVK